MLTQTQVTRVIPKYIEFIKRFPKVNYLAKASTADVLRMWKGMGYNRRAVYLKKIAEIGRFPKSEKELIKLPGVGIYIARAILVFAYKQNIQMVDTNIRKIIMHFFFDDVQQKEKVIQKMAYKLLPQGKSWEWHQALMDYGAWAKLPTPIKKKTIPFKESNRFFRGRIIDMLRQKARKEVELIEGCARFYDRSEEFFYIIITGLEKDGLVIRKNEKIFLPT